MMEKLKLDLYNRIGIYEIKNKITGEAYVGQTKMNFGDRRDSHFSQLNNNKHSNKLLQESWNKYGKDNFEFNILHDLQVGEDIYELERKYIKGYMELNKSLNLSPGGKGSGNVGLHLSEITKKKIGEKNRINMTGFIMPEATKEKISKQHKEAWAKLSDEEKKEKLKNFSGCNKGKKMNPEAYKKLLLRERTHSNAAKYSVELVHKIRNLHEVQNLGYTEIANIVKIPRYTVYLIATYRRWKYV